MVDLISRKSFCCNKIVGNLHLFFTKVSVKVAFMHKHFNTTFAAGWFQRFSAKKHLNAHGFARDMLQFSRLCRLGEGLKKHSKSSRLHSKKNFLRGRWGLSVSDIKVEDF